MTTTTRAVTHHCRDCGEEVGDEGCATHPGADIDSVLATDAMTTTTITAYLRTLDAGHLGPDADDVDLRYYRDEVRLACEAERIDADDEVSVASLEEVAARVLEGGHWGRDAADHRAGNIVHEVHHGEQTVTLVGPASAELRRESDRAGDTGLVSAWRAADGEWQYVPESEVSTRRALRLPVYTVWVD